MFSHISEENGKSGHIIGIMTIKMFLLRQKRNLKNGLKAVHTSKEMNPIEVKMEPSLLSSIDTDDLFDGKYEKTAEFLNTCKPFYDVQ